MPNHLVHENSPYLQQHASNPVDWYPWGEEALARSRSENKPIFLSIGYAACHWCHVMERESFEDFRTAELLNSNFVSIKVDREQRPDLDSLYMRATNALTGSGGWPMSVFLTPDLRPFYAGTYFPPAPRHNLPAFTDVLTSVALAWHERPGELNRLGEQVIAHLRAAPAPDSIGPLDTRALAEAADTLIRGYDLEFGGWGRAPKFPQPMVIDFLLRRAASSGEHGSSLSHLALHALGAMARGGMYDVVGGGFSRYSTDEVWRVPHFEKMLYDNAQLALAYLHAWQWSGSPFYKRIVIETLDFVSREMTHPAGGFYSSLDADSEGTEGKFYVWTTDELRLALADVSLWDIFVAAYRLTASGNWDGKTVLHRALDDGSLAAQFKTDETSIRERLAEGHRRLLDARASRIRPATDDKVICAWNGLMLRAFAQAGRFLGDEALARTYRYVATRNAAFLLRELRPGGQLRRVWRAGNSSPGVFLDDFAGLILGLLDLYQSDFDNQWFTAAEELAAEMIARFSDPAGGFFDTPIDADPLPIRPKDLQDNATPCGNALACEALLKLAALGSEPSFRDRAEQALKLVWGDLGRFPMAFGHWLNAADFADAGGQQLAIVYPPGSKPDLLLKIANTALRPNLVVAASEFPPAPGSPRLLSERAVVESLPTAYVCEHFTCKLPVNDPAELGKQLLTISGPPA